MTERVKKYPVDLTFKKLIQAAFRIYNPICDLKDKFSNVMGKKKTPNSEIFSS